MGIDDRLEGHEKSKGLLAKDVMPVPADTGLTRAEVLSVLNEEEHAFETLKTLKATVDSVIGSPDKEGPQLLFAMEKLVSTAFEDGLLSAETLEKLGFSPAVSAAIMDIVNKNIMHGEEATQEEMEAVRVAILGR